MPDGIIVIGGGTALDIQIKEFAKQLKALHGKQTTIPIATSKKKNSWYKKLLGNLFAILFLLVLTLGLIWLIVYLIKGILLI